MLSNPCQFEGCNKLPIFRCSCSSISLSCEHHITSHIVSPGNHIASSIIISVAELDKPKVFDYLVNQKKNLNQHINDLKNFSHKVINLISEETKKSIKGLLIEQKNLNSSIKALNCSSYVYKKIFKEVKSGDQTYYKKFDKDYLKLLNIVKIALTNDIKLDHKDDKFAFIMEKSFSNQIELVNLKTLRKTSIQLPVDDLANYSGFCRVDENKYFIYGGYSEKCIGSARVIDTLNKTIENVSSDIEVSFNGLCCLGQIVYCFGGWNGSAISECKKFNLMDRRWDHIQSLPLNSHHTTASALNYEILVASYENSAILSYSPILNSFKKSDYVFLSQSGKYLFENWVVWNGNFLYEIDQDENLIKRAKVGHDFDCLNSYGCFKRGKSIYFITSKFEIYRIKTDLKTLEVIN